MNAVDLIHVDVAFHSERGIKKALNDITLHIPAKRWTAVIGQNGSGKSTLARVLANLIPISRGELRIMQEPVQAKIHSRVHMVFQNPDAQIIGETIFEDVAFGLSVQNIPTEKMRSKVFAILRPFGLHEWMDKPVSILSGGQKQLLCIASCLAMNPDIIVFDECTSMLDEGARQTVRAAARFLKQSGKTIIWITHHLEELTDADEVVVFESGKVRFQGEPLAFFYATDPNQPGHSWCHKLGFTPPYVIQIAEQLREAHGWSWFTPLHATELVQGGRESCQSK